jgi:Family of unknown function (DUF6221)
MAPEHDPCRELHPYNRAKIAARLQADKLRAGAAEIERDAPAWASRMRREANRMEADMQEFLAARIDEDEVLAQAPRRSARLLREVEAKRKILALHPLTVTKVAQPEFDPFTGDRIPDSYEVTCETCGWASDNPASGCATLRALAAVYSSNPDYDPAWKDAARWPKPTRKHESGGPFG